MNPKIEEKSKMETQWKIFDLVTSLKQFLNTLRLDTLLEPIYLQFQIGFTRNGKILAEGSPSELMIRYNCSTLEEVFLHLCRKQFTNLADEQMDYKVNMYQSC